MIINWSNVYVPYLYMWIKFKCMHVYIKSKKGWGAYIKVSKTLLFKYVSNNKQNKLRQMKKDEIKEETHLNYKTVNKICFLFSFMFIFRHFNLLNKHKNMLFFFHLLIYSWFVCYNHSTKEAVYHCFNLGLRRSNKNTHNYAYFEL